MICDQLEQIVAKALALDPEARYQTADDLKRAIERFAESEHVSLGVRSGAELIPGRPNPGGVEVHPASGKIYWTEVTGSPGIYNVRWRPNALGYWRLLISYAAGTQIMGQDYDIVSQVPLAESGLRASFTRPCNS